jgi:FkbM family methyltransferase
MFCFRRKERLNLLLPYAESKFILELRALGRGKLFVDVGSHVGWYTVNLADLFFEVWAIEPYKPYADGLRENLKKFGIMNVRIIEKAVSDKSGNSLLYMGEDCPSLKNMLNISYFGKQKALTLTLGEVETVTLSELVGDREVDLVKVDTEGAEKDILLGSKQVMQQIKAWHIEVHDWNETKAITEFLESFKFKVRERGLDGRNKGWLLATK